MTIRKLFSKASAVVLSLCLIGGVTGFEPGEFAVGANASTRSVFPLTYTIYSDHAEVIACNKNAEGDVTIPEEIEGVPVTSIDLLNYNEQSNIDSFIIPKTITNASLLFPVNRIIVSEKNSTFCDIDGVLFTKDKETLVKYPVTRSGDYTIPDTTKKIGNDAFWNCAELAEIVIPDSVTSIGEDAFYYCKSLKSINIPESVFTIGHDSFWNCQSLTSIKIPDFMTKIEFQCFGHCKNLKSIIIPDSVTEIVGNAFLACDSLTDIIYYGTEERWNNIKIDFTNGAWEDVEIHYGVETSIPLFFSSNNSFLKRRFSNDLNILIDKTNSTSYSPELASMLCVMSQSAYDEECVRANYNELGFDTHEVYDYDTTSTQADNCGYVIGYQDLEDGTREFLITVRGTANGKEELVGEEWWSDFNLGFNVFSDEYNYPKYHHGFYMAAERIWESLKKYNDGSVRTDKVRYVLTGHSRGAAVSNIISKWLIDEGVSKNDLYSYNFACPGVSIDKNPEFTANQYSSIFNINCARDIVGQAPGTALSATTSSFWGSYYDDELTQRGKYGMTYFWDEDWLTVTVPDPIGAFKYHPCDTSYIPYLSNQPELSEFKTYGEMRPIQWKNTAIEKITGLFGIGVKQKTGKITGSIMPPIEWNNSFSDLTVIIKDTLGNVVGTVKDKTVSIEKEYADRIDAQIIDGRVDFSIDADSGYQISVESETPATIAVSQENAAYNSVNNGAVYTAEPGNTTIDIAPDTPAAETHVTDASGKAIEPDKVWNLGDVNGDRSANIADAVLLQKWLLNKPDSDLTEWTAADIYEDGKLNVYDLTLLKQLITE